MSEDVGAAGAVGIIGKAGPAARFKTVGGAAVIEALEAAGTKEVSGAIGLAAEVLGITVVVGVPIDVAMVVPAWLGCPCVLAGALAGSVGTGFAEAALLAEGSDFEWGSATIAIWVRPFVASKSIIATTSP